MMDCLSSHCLTATKHPQAPARYNGGGHQAVPNLCGHDTISMANVSV
jgi:hypothetical protein